MKTNQLKQQLRIPKFLSRLGLGIAVFAFSLQTGMAHFNFIPDTLKISVKETAPPSLALLEVNASYISDVIASEIVATPLRVGSSLLPQLELEELVIGELEQVEHNLVKTPPSMTLASDNNEVNFPEDLNRDQMIRLKTVQAKYNVLNENFNSSDSPSEESLGDKIQKLDRQYQVDLGQEKSRKGIIIRGTDGAEKNEMKVQSEGETLTSNTNSGGISIQVEGLIEFARKTDLVLTPDHRIEVRRFSEGVPQEFGLVKLPEATFNIQIQKSYGTIVAQLINSNGVVEGQGSMAVQEIVSGKNKKPTILIKPAPKGHIQVASAYGPSFQKDFQKNLSFNIFGAVDYSEPLAKESYFDNTYSDSEAIVQASAKNHVATTAVISLIDGADLMLLPDRMIDGLVDILSQQKQAFNLNSGDALIWGQIRKNGKPIEGATVFAERAEPIYFGNMYLPDQLRTKTSENGIFVIVVNEPGWSDLVVEQENGSKMHLNVLTFPGKVAQVFADLPLREIPVSVRSYDAFSGAATRSKVQIQQVEDIIDTGDLGLSVINFPETQTLSFINVFPEAPYMDAKYSYSKLLDYIHLPLVRKDWIESIGGKIKYLSDPNKGIVIGFVQNSNFDLVPSSPSQTTENLIYFNSNGEGVPSGTAGGGFILFNQPPGFIGVTIEDSSRQRKFHKLAFPENRFLSILSFSL